MMFHHLVCSVQIQPLHPPADLRVYVENLSLIRVNTAYCPYNPPQRTPFDYLRPDPYLLNLLSADPDSARCVLSRRLIPFLFINTYILHTHFILHWSWRGNSRVHRITVK